MDVGYLNRDLREAHGRSAARKRVELVGGEFLAQR